MIGRWHVLIAAVCLAAAMLVVAVAWRSRWARPVVLALLSVAWFGLDQAFEGPVLVSVDSKHGLTLADLVGVAGLLVAAGVACLQLGRSVGPNTVTRRT